MSNIVPDAIIVFSAATVSYEKGGQTRWRTTTYDDRDAFGTLGGRDRVEAAALLAKKYPKAYIVTTSKRITGEATTLAEVYANEIIALGIARECIVEETNSTTTGTQVQEAIRLAEKRGWRNLIFLLSEYLLPRTSAFYEQTKSAVRARFISSESVLIEHNPSFAVQFAEIKKTVAYQERLASEARGLAALKAGTYRSTLPEDKRER